MQNSVISGATINTKQYQQAVLFLLTNCSKYPIYVFGETGLGKSYIPEAIAKDLGIPFIYYNATGLEPQDLIGLPSFTQTEDGQQATSYNPPSALALPKDPKTGKISHISKQPKGILMLDEASRLEYQVLNTLMQLLDRKALGELSIPKGWLIILTANPSTEDYQVRDMDKALLRRCILLELMNSLDTWREWGEEHGVSKKVLAMAGRMNKTNINKRIETNMRQYPSNAGYVMCSDLLNAGLENQDVRFQQAMLSGAIGPEGCAALLAGLSDEKLREAVTILLAGGKISGTADFFMEASYLFMLEIKGKEKEKGNEVYNLYTQAPMEVKPVIMRFFANQTLMVSDNDKDNPYYKMSEEYKNWQLKIMTGK